MISKEGAIRKFVRAYVIEVPRELVEEKHQLCLTDMRHKMVCGQMTGSHHMNLYEQAQVVQDAQEELMEVAYFTVKEELVMKALMNREEFSVTDQELQDYAEAMARRQNTTMDMVCRFFGDDLALLAGDVRHKKAEEWIYHQVNGEG